MSIIGIGRRLLITPCSSGYFMHNLASKCCYSSGIGYRLRLSNKRNLFYNGLLFCSFSGLAYFMYSYFKLKASVGPKSTLVQNKPFHSSSGISKSEMTPDIPNHAKYLIIGGGAAAASAVKSIKACDPSAKVLLVSEEKYFPYMRPPLSKGALISEEVDFDSLKYKQWNDKSESLYILGPEVFSDPKSDSYLNNGGIAILQNHKVCDLNLRKNCATLDNGWEITFEKCLLATGSVPVQPNWIKKLSPDALKKVSFYRNIDDLKRLYDIAKSGKSVAIIGSGFLAGELSFALSAGRKSDMVTLITSDAGLLRPVLPKYLSDLCLKILQKGGVTVVENAVAYDAKITDSGKLNVFYRTPDKTDSSDHMITADHLIVAMGAEPNTELALNSGLEIDPKSGGYLVNAELRARQNVWAAGDVASFYDIMLNERRRVQHYEHAVSTGRVAGENMASSECRPFYHQSMFWSDLGINASFEAVGLIDSSLKTVAIFLKEDGSILKRLNPFSDDAEKFTKGVVYYMKNDRIVGILFWNIFDKILLARRVIGNEVKENELIAITKTLLSVPESNENRE